MRWFSNLNTRWKLVFSFGVLCVVLIGLTADAYVTLGAMQANERGEIDAGHNAALTAREIRAVQNRIRAYMLDMFLANDAEAHADVRQKVEASSREIDAGLATIRTFVTTRGLTNAIASLATLEQDLADYRAGRDEQFQLISTGKRDEAIKLAGSIQDQRFERIRTSLVAISDAVTAHDATAIARSVQLFDSARQVFIAATALCLLLAVSMGWMLSRLIVDPLIQTTKVIRDIAAGTSRSRLNLGRRDEIGALADAADSLSDTINMLVADAGMLATAGVEGRLATRADVGRHQGDFRKIVQGVNDTLDAVIGPLNVAAAYVDRVATGEIPRPITATYRGDFELLKNNLNKMSGNLRILNSELQVGFGVLASSSAEILATVSQVASGAAETASAVSQTSTTAEEVKQTAELSSRKARAVQDVSMKTNAVSETGRLAVIETLEVMTRIREQMDAVADSVVRLSEQGQAIGEIIATVNDLAEQSNLLAVNAAIEATRAGEYGKGFGVVAQEVKSLAEQSRQATTQVRTILMEVQKATSAAVMATEQGTKAVVAGVKQATEAGSAIGVLTGSVTEASQAAMQIAASSQQQLVGMDQITLALANIRQATTQNMAGTRQLEASAQSLTDLGGRLKVLVERQRVEA